MIYDEDVTLWFQHTFLMMWKNKISGNKRTCSDMNKSSQSDCLGKLYLKSLTWGNFSVLGVYCPGFCSYFTTLVFNDKLVNTDTVSNECSNYLNAPINLLR